MTINEALTAFDALRPNMYTQAEKIAWLSECDGLIWHDVLAMRQRPPVSAPPWPDPLEDDDSPSPFPPSPPVEDEETWAGEDESVQAFDYFGVPLASDSRTLKIDHSGGYTGSITSVSFTGGTVEEDALIGRVILLNGVRATVTDNAENSISFDSTNFGTVADASVIYPGEIDPDKYQLLVPFPYDRDVYIYYLMMMNDQMNGETDKYNQSAKLFNTALLNYRNYVNRQRTPTRTVGTARFWW